MFKEYVLQLLTLCLFFAVLISVSHERTRSTVSFGAGILIISAILLPLVDIIRDFSIDDYIDSIYGEVGYENVSDTEIEMVFEAGIAAYVAKEYGVKSECVSVRVDGFDMEFLRADRIYVTLRGEAIRLDYKRIERELAEEFTQGGECEVMLSLD